MSTQSPSDGEVSPRQTDHDLYVDAVRRDADLISACVRTGSLDAPIASCPGWDLRKLVEHTSFIHRWAAQAIRTGAAPGRDDVARADPDENLAVWIVDGAAALIETLAAADVEAATWHPFPFDQKVWVWGRRMAIETSIHRWDAQRAVGMDASLDASLASRGIGEYFELGLPRALTRDEIAPPELSLHVHCTDVDGEWLVWNDDGRYRMLPVHDKGDAAMRGTAQDLLLVLMGRLDRNAVDIVGDPAAAAAWLDLPDW